MPRGNSTQDDWLEAARRYFDEQFALHADSVRGMIYHLLFDSDEQSIEDAYQETACRVWTSITKGRWPEQLLPWMKGFGLRVCREMNRRSGKQRDREVDLAAGSHASSDPASEGNPEGILEEKALRGAVGDEVRALREDLREAIVLRYQGHTFEELGIILDIPIWRAKYRVRRAMEMLRQELEDWF